VIGALSALAMAAMFGPLIEHHFGARAARWPALWFGLAATTPLWAARLPWAARTGFSPSRNWLPTWACRKRPSTAAGGNGACGVTGSAGTCGSVSGTWRNGSRTGRYDRGQIFKRCDCVEWNCCPHQWVVRYRTPGGRSSRQREQSFGDDLREAEDFALKVEHDKRARTFVDPKAGRILFREAAGACWTSISAQTPASPPTGQCSAPTSTQPSAASR